MKVRFQPLHQAQSRGVSRGDYYQEFMLERRQIFGPRARFDEVRADMMSIWANSSDLDGSCPVQKRSSSSATSSRKTQSRSEGKLPIDGDTTKSGSLRSPRSALQRRLDFVSLHPSTQRKRERRRGRRKPSASHTAWRFNLRRNRQFIGSRTSLTYLISRDVSTPGRLARRRSAPTATTPLSGPSLAD